MSINLKNLADSIQAHINNNNPTTNNVKLKFKFDGTFINIHATHDKFNNLGNWFACCVYEKKLPFSEEIIGIGIDYFDANNYVHHFINYTKSEHNYNKTLKILAIILQEFKKQKLFLTSSRFHVQHTSAHD
jgi:hypothetical protein